MRTTGKLRGVVTQMAKAAKRDDTTLMFQLDQQFHELLWEYADHQLLLNISSQLRNRIRGFLVAANLALVRDDRMAHANSHGLLLDAIASGNAATVSAAMAEHIASARERIAETAELASNDDTPPLERKTS